jgi:uncharacterized protein YqgC (DUF456 family)
MEILLLILAFLLFAVGILGAIIPVIPGPPLSFLGLLLMQWSGYGDFSPAFLWIWAGIAASITIMDYFLPSLMTKKLGGSRSASIGSFLGLLTGIFIFPPWGMIVGPFFGALIGELIQNRGSGAKALKIAFGTFLAFILGSGVKLIVCSLILFYALRAMFLA